MNDITVNDIIEDIKRGNHYHFALKPTDEDEQDYSPNRKKGGPWLITAFCVMATIKTPNLINRLETRRDAKVIKTEKRSSQLLIGEAN